MKKRIVCLYVLYYGQFGVLLRELFQIGRAAAPAYPVRDGNGRHRPYNIYKQRYRKGERNPAGGHENTDEKEHRKAF